MIYTILDHLPGNEATRWEVAAVRDDASRMVKFTRHEMSTDFEGFIEEVNERLVRWRKGLYSAHEIVGVLADKTSEINSTRLLKQIIKAALGGELTLRENGIPASPSDLERSDVIGAYFRQEDINTWLRNAGAGFELVYPYTEDDAALLPESTPQAAPASEPVMPAALIQKKTDKAEPSKRERQIRAIESAISNLGLSSMKIPTGEKNNVRAECKRISDLFGGGIDPFKEAWQEAVNQKRVRTVRHKDYARK